jgi:hypothetical protein
MREEIVSSAELAIRAGKEKLATISEREGYTEAMQVVPRDKRTAQLVFYSISAGLAGLTTWSWLGMANGPLRWVLVLVLAGLGVLSLLAAIGSAPTAPPEAWPVAVLEAGDDDLVLLRDDGTTKTILCPESLRAALRRGDVGVAHVRAGSMPIVVAFHRL